jgi:hypothetical protein
MSELAAAAVVYARRGWHVFPLVPKRKTPLTRHGLLEASRDVRLVAGLWAEQPRANIGIACEPSGLLVVDVDGDQAVSEWTRLAGSGEGHGRTLTARTGGGFHVYFAGRGRSSVGRLGAGIDTRGAGGYVVAPPSVHGSGAVYRWLDAEAPVAAVPEWLADALELRLPAAIAGERRRLPDGFPYTQYGLAALTAIVDEMAATPEGQRNTTLNALAYRAGRLVAAGELSKRVAFQELIDAALASGLRVDEAGRTFDSGFRAGLQLPVQTRERRPS